MSGEDPKHGRNPQLIDRDLDEFVGDLRKIASDGEYLHNEELDRNTDEDPISLGVDELHRHDLSNVRGDETACLGNPSNSNRSAIKFCVWSDHA